MYIHMYLMYHLTLLRCFSATLCSLQITKEISRNYTLNNEHIISPSFTNTYARSGKLTKKRKKFANYMLLILKNILEKKY